MSRLAHSIRLKCSDGRSLSTIASLAVSGWPLQLTAELSESAQVQLMGIGVTCEPATLSTGTTTVVVRMCEEADSEELAIECRQRSCEGDLSTEVPLRFCFRLATQRAPDELPRSMRLLMHEVPQAVKLDESWKDCNVVVEMPGEDGKFTAVPIFVQSVNPMSEYGFRGPGRNDFYGHACSAQITDAGHMRVRSKGSGAEVLLSLSLGKLNSHQAQNNSRDSFWVGCWREDDFRQWLNPVKSGPRLALTDDAVVSVSEDGEALSEWPLPPNCAAPVAAAQISANEVLVLTKDRLCYSMTLVGQTPIVFHVGRLRSNINGQQAALIRQVLPAEETNDPLFLFRSAGVSGPCWSTIHLQPHHLLTAEGLTIPFEVKNVVKMLRFLQDDSNAAQQRQEQTLRDFARRELQRFGRWFLPLLAEKLHRPELSRACRHFSLDLLQELNSPEIIDDLLYLTFSGDDEFALRAVKSLEDYPCEDARIAYETVLAEHTDSKVRLLAVSALMNWAVEILEETSPTEDRQSLFCGIIRLLSAACGDSDTAKDGVRPAARHALLIVAGFFSRLPELAPIRGVLANTIENVCLNWRDYYAQFEGRWRINAVILLYFIARGFKRGWLPQSTYEMAFQTLLTAVQDDDRKVRLRASRCLSLLGDPAALEAIYQAMAKYADTAAAFATTITQFGS